MSRWHWSVKHFIALGFILYLYSTCSSFDVVQKGENAKIFLKQSQDDWNKKLITWEFSGLPLDSCSTPRRSILSLLTNKIIITSHVILQTQYRSSRIDRRDIWSKCKCVVLYLVNSTTRMKSGQFHFISSKKTVESWVVAFLASNSKCMLYTFSCYLPALAFAVGDPSCTALFSLLVHFLIPQSLALYKSKHL